MTAKLTQNRSLVALALIALAFIFSVSVRYYYPYFLDFSQPKETSAELKYNKTLMINTNDGYFFAEGARELLAPTHEKEINQTKILSQDFYKSQAPVANLFSLLTAFLAKILPISFEQLLFYMPGFIASLVVVPLFMLARSVDSSLSGSVAALFSACVGGVAVSYYNRTMFGYYDTDMFVIVFAMVVGAMLFFGAKMGESNDKDSHNFVDLVKFLVNYVKNFRLKKEVLAVESAIDSTIVKETKTRGRKSTINAEKSEILSTGVPSLTTAQCALLFFLPLTKALGYQLYYSLNYVFIGYFLLLIAYCLTRGRKNYFLHALGVVYGLTFIVPIILANLGLMNYIRAVSSDFFQINWALFGIIITQILVVLYTLYLRARPLSHATSIGSKSFSTHLVLFVFVAVLFLLFVGIKTLDGASSSMYVNRAASTGGSAFFYSTVNTIAEVSSIDFSVFAYRIAGSIWAFLLTFIGIAILIWRDWRFLIFAPMLALGYFAYFKGLRFTIYAVPIHALGIAGLTLGAKMLLRVESERAKNAAAAVFAAALGVAVLIPNFIHIQGYITKPVFNAYEVAALESLKSKAKRGDKIIAWWDYGYPLRYYSGLNTTSDGGAQHGALNYHTSLILSHPNQVIAFNTLSLFSMGSNVLSLAQIFRLENTDDLMAFLSRPMTYSKEPRHDTYIYLPFRMLDIFPVVARFREIKLESGAMDEAKFFYMPSQIAQNETHFVMDNSATLDKKTLEFVISPEQRAQLNMFVEVATEQSGKNAIVQILKGDEKNQLAAVYLKNYNRIIIAHMDYINSVYFRGFVFENLDTNAYELVERNPFVKIYKAKDSIFVTK